MKRTVIFLMGVQLVFRLCLFKQDAFANSVLSDCFISEHVFSDTFFQMMSFQTVFSDFVFSDIVFSDCLFRQCIFRPCLFRLPFRILSFQTMSFQSMTMTFHWAKSFSPGVKFQEGLRKIYILKKCCLTLSFLLPSLRPSLHSQAWGRNQTRAFERLQETPPFVG